MWTLNDIRTFVCSKQVEVECPVCKSGHSPFKGKLVFLPALVFYPQYDDRVHGMQAHLGVDVMLDRQSCQCSLVETEFAMCRKFAHSKMYNLFSTFLDEQKKTEVLPLLPREAHHQEDVLSGVAY